MPALNAGPISTSEREINMKLNKKLLTLVFVLAGAAACFASDPNLGTWKLNEAKSTIPAGAPKNMTVTYTADGNKYKCVVEGVDGAGKPTHNEWTGMFDGKDYPLVGDPGADTRAVKKVGDNKYTIANKKGGKTTLTGAIDLSADGKTRTLVSQGTSADGKKISTTFVYDKQ
jgi:hypothetical protein